MPKEVKDQYSTVQINSSLGWRLCPWSVVLGIQNRVDMRFGMHRVFMGWGQVDATAWVQNTVRHSQWVMVKMILCMGFLTWNEKPKWRHWMCYSFIIGGQGSIIHRQQYKSVLAKICTVQFLCCINDSEKTLTFTTAFLRSHSRWSSVPIWQRYGKDKTLDLNDYDYYDSWKWHALHCCCMIK